MTDELTQGILRFWDLPRINRVDWWSKGTSSMTYLLQKLFFIKAFILICFEGGGKSRSSICRKLSVYGAYAEWPDGLNGEWKCVAQIRCVGKDGCHKGFRVAWTCEERMNENVFGLDLEVKRIETGLARRVRHESNRRTRQSNSSWDVRRCIPRVGSIGRTFRMVQTAVWVFNVRKSTNQTQRKTRETCFHFI